MPDRFAPLEESPIDQAVAAAVAERRAQTSASGGTDRVVLAVSGGRDSMAMLHAFARVAPDAVATVATFDHATGPHSAASAQLVLDCSARLGLRAVRGVAEAPGTSEAAWRAARWRFLRAVAATERASVATAHTRDDNVETILIRTLRGSGARGLAGLFAASDVARPFLDLSRAQVERDAREHGVEWIDDPSNASLAHLRNRVRHELLPALLRARPGLADGLLDIGARAAGIRRALDEIAARMVIFPANDGSLIVATASLRDYDPEALRALWPAIAARAEIVLDRRGTAGLARFTKEAVAGDRMQLSGGFEVLRRHEDFVLRPPAVEAPPAATLGDGLEWGRWRFATRQAGGAGSTGTPPSAWMATLPVAKPLVVRAWRDGDRMHGAGDAGPRRVKRFLRDAGLVGPERQGWPVVVCGDEVVWIPGVRRSDAATVRSGRPEAVYVCERSDS
jgi:tRNA(Ile)-lysidine synthase